MLKENHNLHVSSISVENTGFDLWLDHIRHQKTVPCVGTQYKRDRTGWPGVIHLMCLVEVFILNYGMLLH